MAKSTELSVLFHESINTTSLLENSEAFTYNLLCRSMQLC